MDKAKQYSSIKHRIALINIFLTPAILLLLLFLDAPTYFKTIAHGVSANDYVNLIAFYLLMAAFYYIITLPLEFYSSFTLEHRFSLSNQKLEDWIIREAKKNLVALIISVPITLAIYAFLRFSPVNWWLWTASLWFFLSIILAKFAPVAIVPLFYKYSPIKDAGLEKRLNDLISKVGFRSGGVYELNISRDTKKANAALLGLGKQKRIVLCDTLIQNFSHDEIESVMAHELGHHKLNHIWELIISGGIFTFAIFFFADPVFFKLHNFFGYNMISDYESLVLIYFAVSALSIFFIPLSNAFSRRLEKNADGFALKTTGNPAAFISAMKKLSEQNLSETNPGKIYEIMLYDHPPISRRIAFAESFKKISATNQNTPSK
ncbi:MAG: M48 family metallopeptidase [Candidatus Omnitrophota bacterium]|nr:M48 family metallopeptidase [Candidatus Omnitrophota bacterium]